uniref:Uncharacterized protein n=1 Tax=Bombyx mori TaxID=7091 RepID=A0A8R2G9N6_BOMMO|nr:zinc finger protein 568 isoform X5 [Bombyx mori]
MENSGGNMCRCCASEGVYKDLNTTYHWMGEEEVYGDMLKDCFNVQLSVPESSDGGICEVCITQLRNAINFKKQVLLTEEQFKKHVQKVFKTSIVKVEALADDDSTDANVTDDGLSEPEFDEVPIKTEHVAETVTVGDEIKPKKRAAPIKASTSRTKKSKSSDAESPKKRVARGTRIIRIEKQKPSIERNFVSSDKHTDVQQNKTNLINILLYSNANLFKSKDALGFECEFCLKRFPEAGALKTHFTNEYRKVKLSKTMLNNIFHRVVKVDATNLRCTICDSSIDKLHDMICHLKDLHRKSVFPDVKNLILPFKFDTVELRCAICGLEFAAFKRLQEHMHSHYPNYKCETCGAGFLTEQLKASHVRRHGTGQHKCDYCEKTFNNSQYKKIHVGRSHLGHTTPFKCTVCNERFAQLWKKNSHMVTAHGGEPVVIKCQACDRTFQSKQHLSVHTKRDHLLERRYECTECDKRFFMKSGLSRHMAKHGTLKQYKCDVCLKAFARKHTLREHIRIHMNDRRFACVHCGQAFVQKCSWKSHMRSKHGEIV